MLWGPLSVRTDVVGYPIWGDFNPYNYFIAFYFSVVLFPIAALLLFLGLTWLGPKIGLPVPSSRGSLRPGTPSVEARPPLDGDPALADAPVVKQHLVTGARVAFVGAVLGLEAGIAANHLWRGLMLGLVIYTLAAVVAAAALNRRGIGATSLEERLAAVNAIATPLSVAGLSAVSAHTEVRILADHSVMRYPWFPVWLGIPAATVLIGWVAIALRRAGSAYAVAAIERRALVLIAAPACLFLFLAALPGDMGTIDLFDSGQGLVATRLVGDGWLPWRDVVVAHGLLTDVASPAIGFAVFGNSYWGHIAGSTVLTGPLYYVSSFFLLVYLFGRNWTFLLLSALIFVGTSLVGAEFRFILWPLILLLLAAVLNCPTRLRSTALALLAVGQTMVTPEAAPALLAVTVVLVVYEWYWRQPGTTIAGAFQRTLWFAGTGVALTAAFAAYLATRGALDDFVYITINLVRGHTVDGALPLAPNPGTISRAQFDFMALAPPAALLISFAYAVVRVRLRRGVLTEDWVMAAAALFVLLYYPKFLSRMDTGHVYQPFGVALPLLLFILYRAVAAIERLIHDRWPGNLAARITAHPVGLGLVVLATALLWGTLHDRVANAPAHYRPAVVENPRFPRVGYAESFDGPAYRDLRRVIDAYLSPNDRLYDFTNEPALFYYLIDRYPSTRYFLSGSLTDTAELQMDVVNRLKETPPKLIIFDNTSSSLTGLSSMDGVPNDVRLYKISKWILDRYRPLLTTHDHTIYARRDMPPASKVGFHLAGAPATRGVPFRAQPCTWGYAPNFLSSAVLPPPGAKSVGARVGGVQHPQATLLGWAGDQHTGEPAVEVIAAVDGNIVGRATPRIERLDLPAGGWPPGFARAGFRIHVPAAIRNSKQLHVFGVARDGSIAELPSGTSGPLKGTVRIAGRNVRLDPGAVAGHIDLALGAPSRQIALPPGARWSDFHWLEIDADRKGFRQGAFALFDRQGRPSAGREISFQTLDRSPDRFMVPVGSCPQWHGYQSRRLFLAMLPQQDIASVRLIR